MNEVLKFIESLSEDELRELVLMPLLLRMGYQDVRSHHGPQEFGKDVVFSQRDPLARVRHYSAVLKRGPLSGSVSSSNSIRTALMQVQQSIDTPYFDSRNGEEVNVDGVYLVTAHALSEQAIASCRGALVGYRGRVTFIDGSTLSDLIRDYYPDFAWSLPKGLPVIGVQENSALLHNGKKESPVQPKMAFVLMPFGGYFDAYYATIFRPGLEAAGFVVQRADDMSTPQPIIKDIQQAIVRADLILCELSGRNPNVFYELGIAHAIGKPVVPVCDKLEDVPFDIRHIRIITYDCRAPEWSLKLRDAICASALSIDPTEIWPPPLLTV